MFICQSSSALFRFKNGALSSAAKTSTRHQPFWKCKTNNVCSDEELTKTFC